MIPPLPAVRLMGLLAASVLFAAGPALAQQPPSAAGALPNPFAPGGAPAPAPAQTQTSSRAAVPTARPEVERALNAVLRNFTRGEIDYSLFSEELAAAIREQAPTITPLIQGFGPVQGVGYLGQEQGADLFSVRFERADTLWLIGLNADGRIGALLFRPMDRE